VLDLNHIFLFLAFVSPLAVLASSWRSHTGNESWRIAAGVVLAVTGIAWIVIREQAGYIGAGAWLALLFLPAMGLKRMTELSVRQEFAAARKLATGLQWLHPSAHLRDEIRTLHYLEKRKLAGDLPPTPVIEKQRPLRLRHAPMVTLLIILNLLAFAVELYFRLTGSSESEMLLRLGAVQPVRILFEHEYWRLFAALFLHAGAVHLAFNLFALYVLGPPFERAIGSLRFIACYLIAGLCSTAGVVILWRLGLNKEAELVGASGCVMGIVGAWAAFLLRDYRTPMVRRRLANIGMIVVIQTVFDLTTEQVSMTAHLCGLAGGFLIGLAIFRRRANGPLEGRRVTANADL
jgi:membrane associated rhomboid family serine protease